MADAQLAASGRTTGNRDMTIYGGIAIVGALFWWLSAYHVTWLGVAGPWDFSWGWYLFATLSLFWYLRGLARLPAHQRPAPWRRVVFLLGVALVYIVLQTRFDYLAQHMFFMNRLQHIVMHHLGPFLIALAWPAAPFARGVPEPLHRLAASRPVRIALRIIQQPVLAAFLFVGLIALWLTPPVHFRAMIDPRLYGFMNWTMVVDGLVVWFLVLDPLPTPPAFCSFPVRIITAVLVMFPQIAIGAMIAFARFDIYPFFAWCGRAYPSMSAIDDQQIGGLIIWIPAAMMSVVALLLIINALRLHEEAGLSSEEFPNADHRGPVISSAGWTGQ
ncbi:MAG: cytochrome c oxidase assembly protein [Pararhizobium sp.]